MTADELRAKGFVENANGTWSRPPSIPVGRARETPKLERHARDEPLEKIRVQAKPRGRFFVSVTSFRRNLLDEDNLCEKYHVDLCRHSGALPGDDPGQAHIEVSQQKVGLQDKEFVRIEIYAPPNA